MVNRAKPRQVVFGLLKTVWGIGHQDSFSLLADEYTASKYNAERKTALSREIVNVELEKYPLCTFKPFELSSAAIVSAMHSAKRGPTSNSEIVKYFSSQASNAMCESLAQNGLSATLFENAMADIVCDDALNCTDKAHLAVLLFCATGCTADVRQAVDDALIANKKLGARFRTTQADDRPVDEPLMSADGQQFALLRIDAGGHGGQYVLSVDPVGTEIGRQSTAEHAITDVDMSVSKRHARIWRDDAGLWWIEGLRSTNGTKVIDGITREIIIVEPPALERVAGVSYPPREVHLGDIIVLAGTTQFWVQGL